LAFDSAKVGQMRSGTRGPPAIPTGGDEKANKFPLHTAFVPVYFTWNRTRSFGATREREPSLEAVIIRETHGHAHSNRAKQANGSHSLQEHKARTLGEEDSSILRLQFPATRFQSARQAGPGFSSPAKSHFRARLLLAPPPRMLTRPASEVEAAFLGSQATGEF
jgi:hypothetical protein